MTAPYVPFVLHNMDGILAVSACTVALYWAYTFLRGLQAVHYVPGYRPMFSPLTLFGAILPMTWWNLGLNWTWKYRKTAYFDHKHDVISMVPWLHGQPSFYICSLDVTKQLLSDETRMYKPRELSVPLLQWGENIFSANKEEWKRYRRLMNPAFNAKTYAMVLTQTSKIYSEIMEFEGWEGKSEITIDSFSPLTLRTAFLVMARCAFGMQLAWVSGNNEKLIDDMDVGSALNLVLDTTILRLVIPRWLYHLPIPRLQRIDRTWKSFAKFMKASVQARYEEISGNPDLLNTSSDVFTRLVHSIDGEGKNKLDIDEVIGNTFMLMFAGHETTGIVLAETLAYLALNPEEQLKAYNEILSIISTRDPSLDDLSQLHHTVACFYEALRLYPAGQTLTRTAAEDIPVHVSRPSEAIMVLPKGSMLMIDMIGIHRNPNVFSEPETFKPARWYGVSEPDVSTFGAGARACLGRRFGLIEALSFLSLFLRDWEVSPSLHNGETFQQYEERVMSHAGHVGLSFGVTRPIGLVLRRRH
ncbi:cytochrome P450 [Agrocybe pediades]|nr:cytochrome P450 [Agrocybe pediades]